MFNRPNWTNWIMIYQRKMHNILTVSIEWSYISWNCTRRHILSRRACQNYQTKWSQNTGEFEWNFFFYRIKSQFASAKCQRENNQPKLLQFLKPLNKLSRNYLAMIIIRLKSIFVIEKRSGFLITKHSMK